VGGGPEERERIGKALRGRRRFGAGLALADPAAHSLRIGAARYEI
jgi:hypothetical protein